MEYTKRIDTALDEARKYIHPTTVVSEKIRIVHRCLGDAQCYRDIYIDGVPDPRKLYALMHSLITRFSPGLSASIMVMINTILPVLMKYRGQTAVDAADAIFDGKMVAAFAVTEPAGGSFVFDVLNTKSEASGHGFVISGEKRFITNGHFADLLLVLAKASENKNKWTNCALFVIPGDQDGIYREELAKHGLTDSPISSIKFTDVLVEDSLCITKHSGAVDIFNAISKERSIIGVASLIVAEMAVDIVRSSLSSPNSANICGSRLELTLSWLDILGAKVNYLNSYRNIAMESQDKSLVSSLSKYKLAKGAEDIIEKIWELATSLKLHSERMARIDSYYRDSKVFQIFAGTSDVMLDIIYDLTKTIKLS